jgi:hypothetical protein
VSVTAGAGADGAPTTATKVVVLVQSRAPRPQHLSENYVLDAVELTLSHDSGAWRAAQHRISAATLHGTSCSVVRQVRFTGSAGRHKRRLKNKKHSGRSSTAGDADDTDHSSISYGVAVVLETRSGLEGGSPTRHAQLACLHMATHALVAHGASWIAEAVPAHTFDAMSVAGDDDAIVTVDRNGVMLWSRAAARCTGRIDTACAVRRVVYAHIGGKGMMSLVLAGDDGALYHVAVVAATTTNNNDPSSSASWSLVSPPSLVMAPSDPCSGSADDAVCPEAMACVFDRHDTLIVAAQVGNHHASIDRLAVEAGVSLGNAVCSLQILDSALVDVRPLHNRREVVSAVVIPSRSAATLARARRRRRNMGPTARSAGQNAQTRAHDDGGGGGGGGGGGDACSSAYTRGVVLGVCHGKDEGALLHGEYGFGMRVIAEVGGVGEDAVAEGGGTGGEDEDEDEDEEGVDFGSPDLFSAHAGDAGSLLLFSYGPENHTQVLCLGEDGSFDDAGLLGSVVDGESATLAFGYSSGMGMLVQVTASAIRMGSPAAAAAESASSPAIQCWTCPDGTRIEHATIDEAQHMGQLTCYVATSASQIVVVGAVAGEDTFVELGQIPTGGNPVSALGARGDFVAYSTWESGLVCVCKRQREHDGGGQGAVAAFVPWTTLQAPAGVGGTRCIRSLSFSAGSAAVAAHGVNSEDSRVVDFGACLAVGTGDGCMLCWDLEGGLRQPTVPLSETVSPSACVEIGESPVRTIQWIDPRVGSGGHGFLATSAGRAVLMTRGARNQDFRAFRVCAGVLRGHRSLCLLGVDAAAPSGAHADAAPPPSFAAVTKGGGLALTELDGDLSLRFQRVHMHARPDRITYHSNSQTLVVAAVLPSGHTALRFYDAALDSTMRQLREQILMHRDQRLSVLECIELGGRQMVAAVAFVPSEEGEGGGGVATLPVVVGCGGEGSVPQSTLSLTLLMRKMVAGKGGGGGDGRGASKAKTSRLVLRLMHHMDFDGRCSSVCAVGQGALALAVDDRIFIVRPTRAREHSPDGVQRKHQQRRAGPTPLQVVAGASTPRGGAILSMSALPGNRLLVSEFMAATSLFTFYPENTTLRHSGGEEEVAGGYGSRRLCRIAHTAGQSWRGGVGQGLEHSARHLPQRRPVGETKEAAKQEDENQLYGAGETSEQSRASTTFLGDWATNTLLSVQHTPTVETAAEKRRRQAQHICGRKAESLQSSTICRFHSPVLCVGEGSFQPVGSAPKEGTRSVLVITRGGTVVEVSQQAGESAPLCRTVL